MELSFVSIIVIALVLWYLLSKVSKSKTINVVASATQDMVETSAGWAHASLVNASASANISLCESLEYISFQSSFLSHFHCSHCFSY